jgi:hypothetical protein
MLVSTEIARLKYWVVFHAYQKPTKEHYSTLGCCTSSVRRLNSISCGIYGFVLGAHMNEHMLLNNVMVEN